jgi:hypothetical protein
MPAAGKPWCCGLELCSKLFVCGRCLNTGILPGGLDSKPRTPREICSEEEKTGWGWLTCRPGEVMELFRL